MFNPKTAAQAFAAVGSEPRLEVVKLLVRAGEGGLTVGAVSEKLNIPLSTLAHHLRALSDAELIIQQKRGREIINSANYEKLMELGAYLMKECCQDCK